MRPLLDLAFDWLTFGLGVPILIGVGFSLLADEFEAFKAAKVCFYIAAAWVCGKVLMWSVFSSDKFSLRAFVVFVIFGVVGIGLSEVLRLTTARETSSATPAPVAKLEPDTTTPEDVEQKIKAWSEKLGWGIRNVEEPEMSSHHYFFVEEITLADGVRFKVGRSKQREIYLAFVSQLMLSPEYRKLLDRETAKGPDSKFMHDLAFELSQLGPKVGFKFIGPPLTEIQLLKMVPIDDQLTEFSFVDAVADIDNATIRTREYITTVVEKHPKRP